VAKLEPVPIINTAVFGDFTGISICDKLNIKGSINTAVLETAR
jgi:hypothetical protein